MIQLSAEALAQLGVNPDEVFLLFPGNRNFVTGRSKHLGFGIDGPGSYLWLLGVFALCSFMILINSDNINPARTAPYYGGAVVLFVVLAVQFGRLWLQSRRLSRLLETAKFTEGKVTLANIIAVRQGKAGVCHEIIVHCRIQYADGKSETVRSVNPSGKRGTKLPATGETVIVLLLAERVNIKGESCQRIML